MKRNGSDNWFVSSYNAVAKRINRSGRPSFSMQMIPYMVFFSLECFVCLVSFGTIFHLAGSRLRTRLLKQAKLYSDTPGVPLRALYAPVREGCVASQMRYRGLVRLRGASATNWK